MLTTSVNRQTTYKFNNDMYNLAEHHQVKFAIKCKYHTVKMIDTHSPPAAVLSSPVYTSDRKGLWGDHLLSLCLHLILPPSMTQIHPQSKMPPPPEDLQGSLKR